MSFPTSPSTGKGGKVLINFNDGALVTLASLTKQASYTYKGTVYANLIYTLGTGKTLINMRPAVEPHAYIDCILDGLSINPGASDKVSVTAGTVQAAGVEVAIPADTAVAVTRPAATQGAWVAIHVHKGTGAITSTKGTDTTAGTGIAALVDTYGSAAGERPLIPTTDLLIGWCKLTNGAAVVLGSEIFYDDREVPVDIEILPNIGAVKISSALVACHAGPLTRVVQFTGYYMDNALSEIGTAIDFGLDATSSEATVTTMGRTIKQTEVSGWTFNFNQLACDSKVKNLLLNQQGFCAVRLVYPNGGYWQSVGSFVAKFSNAPGAMNNIAVTGSFADDPIFV